MTHHSPPRRHLLQGALAALGGGLFVPATGARPPPARFVIGGEDFLLDGRPLQIRCGEIHFARVPRAYWLHRLQLIKAMGLNTVCAYLFWNYHEWREGQFDWSGQRDAAEFCRLARSLGLWVILRPGPYACAEWEMGGLPWWLLKHEGDSYLRTRDPAFMMPARRWLQEVGRELGDLQITQGGPILMVQVENEYGFFGQDLDYLRLLRLILLEAKFDVPLFQCNPTHAVVKSHVPELFQVANFGSDPVAGFKALASVQSGPLMCGEYYSGWFDTWGTPHRRGSADKAVADIQTMLKANASFSLYMAHGGTSFGLWGGCDRPFRPDTSSYDYDAPISEAGWIGEKFEAYRAAIRPFLALGEVLPQPPAPKPVIAIAPFTLNEVAGLFDNLPARIIKTESPRPLEHEDISRGLVVYRLNLPAGPAGMLEAAKVRDLAWVTLDGQMVGTMDTRSRQFKVALPARSQAVSLEILLYTIARVNFGIEVHDRKGLHGPVTFKAPGQAPLALENWEIQALDFDADATLPPLNWQPQSKGRAQSPAFWRGHFKVERSGDSFLDLSNWGQGLVWVNGHCLGRFWSIGPTQTMYLPGPWMRTGRNEVVVLDLTGPDVPQLAGLSTPILDRLRPERDLPRPARTGRAQLDGVRPLHQGEFAAGAGRQDIVFARPVSGRQFCLEALSAFDGKPFAAVGELALLDSQGRVLNQSNWTIAFVSSEELEKEDGSVLNAINGQASDHWHSAYGGNGDEAAAAAYPHRLIIDLGRDELVAGLRYTPRQGADGVTGRIQRYRLYCGQALASSD
ncbi:beta-galactosidase [Roseateles oligotrophus]|uniref:Beta-galactosidase n=1 Tax=Roseateles oligotrophus TaxID=1769250 RepID=A0ABT2YAC7_9BURK|nr:beta-galactosidase [Roseateles oligotrophus]MCV2367251.1 beta-galactosidase [Roseateles oligotrophus]